MNLESAYQLAQVKDQDDVVARRASLYSKAPVKEMLRRRWIEPSNSVDVLEKQIVDFFELTRLDDDIRFCAAARQSTSYMDVTPDAMRLVISREETCAAVQARHFTPQLLDEGLERLRAPASKSGRSATCATHSCRIGYSFCRVRAAAADAY